MISKDLRLQAFGILLVPAFVGHTLQLLGEDRPWEAHAWAREAFQPGWHQLLPGWVPVVLAFMLAAAVIGLALDRRRQWLFTIVLIYWAHYLTYPFRIRNHMSHMFSGLTMLGVVWIVGWLMGAHRFRGGGPRSRTVDRHAVNGLALILCVNYFFAGFHKINANFLELAPSSPAVHAMAQFWIYADLGSELPTWAAWCAIYGTLIVECCVPWIAWRVPRLRIPAVLTLFAFHYPMVSTMNVSDYPMIVSAYYPCLFSRAQFRILLGYFLRASRWTVPSAALGVFLQVWAIPWWGELTIFGLFVMGLWGWATGAMLHMVWDRRKRAISPAAGMRYHPAP